MADKTGIEWTDASWNPVTGCTKVSPGCDHCYAETFAERWRGKPGHYFEGGFDVQLRPDKLDLPLRWTKPRRIFVNSMSDLFHDQVPDEYITDVFAHMWWAPQHTFQVLTKRHGRMRSLLPRIEERLRAMAADLALVDAPTPLTWPLPNVWLGVSVENQQWADIRIPALLETPAAVRWISAEPLLGPVDLQLPIDHSTHERDFIDGMPWPQCLDCSTEAASVDWTIPDGPRLDWVVVGGESGPGARPMHPDWARSLRDQCEVAGIPFHFKQWGAWGPAPFIVRVCDPQIGWTGTEEELAEAKRRSEAQGATHVHTGQWYIEDGQKIWNIHEIGHKPWSLERVGLPDGMEPIRRWGKKAAGRELDGRTWDQYPTTATAGAR